MKEYFIKNLVFFALTALAVLAFRLIVSKAKFSRKRSESNVLRYPLSFRIAPLCTVVYFAVVAALVYALAPQDWLYVAAAGIIALCGVVLSLSWSLWRVRIGQDGFEYRSCLGAKRSFVYHEIELRESEQGTKWYFYQGETQVFAMPYFVPGGDKLANTYHAYIRKYNKKDKN